MSYFSLEGFPTVDTSIEVVPFVDTSDVRSLEVAIDDQVGVVEGRVQFDVIDGQTERVRAAGSVKLKHIFSSFELNSSADGVDVIVSGVHIGHNDSVPDNDTLGSQGAVHAVLSGSVLEFEFVGKSLSSGDIAGR